MLCSSSFPVPFACVLHCCRVGVWQNSLKRQHNFAYMHRLMHFFSLLGLWCSWHGGICNVQEHSCTGIGTSIVVFHGWGPRAIKIRAFSALLWIAWKVVQVFCSECRSKGRTGGTKHLATTSSSILITSNILITTLPCMIKNRHVKLASGFSQYKISCNQQHAAQ